MHDLKNLKKYIATEQEAFPKYIVYFKDEIFESEESRNTIFELMGALKDYTPIYSKKENKLEFNLNGKETYYSLKNK